MIEQLSRWTWRRALPLLALLAILPGAAALFLVTTRDQMMRSAENEVNADVAALTRLTDVDGVVTAIEVLEDRGARGASGGLAYLLIDPENGATLAGNMESWPRSIPRVPTGKPIVAAGESPVLIGRVMLLDDHFLLFTGRRIEGFATLRDQTIQVVGGITVIILAGGLIFAFLSIRAAEKRIAAIEATLTAFSQGRRSVRIDDRRHDPLGRVSARVNALLDLVREKLRHHELIAEQIAHELRGPVAKAATAIQGRPGDPAKAFLLARGTIDGLLQMIDGVLFITGMRIRDLKVERVPLHEVASEIAELFGEVAESKEIELERSLHPAFIMGERALIERLTANLVDNALKYSPPGSAVRLRVRADADGALLEISDKGQGLANFPETPGMLLARGQATQEVAGTGLGLALVLRIAERHDAQVHFADREGGGLMVAVRFAPESAGVPGPPAT